jgi:hypothetical protein
VDERFIKRGPSTGFLVVLLLGVGFGALIVGAAITAVGILVFAPNSMTRHALGWRPGTDLDDLEGVWSITYTNNTARVYVIDDAGNVTFQATGARGRLREQPDDTFLLEFNGDGKLERLTLGSDGRLFVEHYDPGAAFPGQAPTQIGIGVRLE